MKFYLHILDSFTITSVIGWRKFIAGKAEYIIKGAYQRWLDSNGNPRFVPTVICNARFEEGSQQMANMASLAQDYIANFDAIEKRREDKLAPACEWKLESLMENGVDFNSAIERKIWQKRPDLLSDAEIDALIDEWEASQ